METNVYQAPESDITSLDNDVAQPVKLFNAKGRMGRIRYMCYTIVLPILLYFAMGIIAAILIPLVSSNSIALVSAALVGIAYIVFCLVVIVYAGIQRSHDFNAPGWLTLISFVPFVPIVFWFIPGDHCENNYGAVTEGNKWFHYVSLIIIPIFIAILAAVAIPAYHDYVERAKAAQIQSQNSSRY